MIHTHSISAFIYNKYVKAGLVGGLVWLGRCITSFPARALNTEINSGGAGFAHCHVSCAPIHGLGAVSSRHTKPASQ